MAKAPPSRLYFDSNVFIELVREKVGLPIEPAKQNDVWFARRLCDAARDGDVRLFTCVLAITECLAVADDKGISDDVKDLFNRFLTSGKVVTLVSADPFVAEDGRRARWDSGVAIKGPDALHVGAARIAGCAEFLTLDDTLIRSVTTAASGLGGVPGAGRAPLGIAVIRPAQTTLLPARYLQQEIPGTERD